MKPYRTLGETFTHIKRLATAKQKVEALQFNLNPAMLYVLKLAFSDIVWLLPEGAPPYKPFSVSRGGRPVEIRPGMAPVELQRELRRLYVLFDESTGISALRRQKIFQTLLEGMESTEAKLLIAVKDKTFSKDFRVSRANVDAAFPGLLDAPFTGRYA